MRRPVDHAITDTDAGSDWNADRDSDWRRHHRNADGESDSVADSQPESDAVRRRWLPIDHGIANTFADAVTFANADGYTNTDADGQPNKDANANADSDSDGFTDQDGVDKPNQDGGRAAADRWAERRRRPEHLAGSAGARRSGSRGRGRQLADRPCTQGLGHKTRI